MKTSNNVFKTIVRGVVREEVGDLRREMHQMEKRLNGRIASVEQRLDERIDKLEKKIDRVLNLLDGFVKNRPLSRHTTTNSGKG